MGLEVTDCILGAAVLFCCLLAVISIQMFALTFKAEPLFGPEYHLNCSKIK